jgi:HK97 family phage portal protein
VAKKKRRKELAVATAETPQVEQRSMSWWIHDWESPFGPTAGVPINPKSALGLSAVFASVRLLSDTIATLPVDWFIRVGDGRESLKVPPTWLDEPGGPWVGRVEIVNQIMASMLLAGTAYVMTPRIGGQVTGLIPLDPAKVNPVQDRPTWNVLGEELDETELMVVRGMMLPGTTEGCSPITYAKETLALGLAAQKFGAAFFGNGAWPGVVAEVPGTLSEDGQKAMKAQWDEIRRGPERAHKIAVLAEGARPNKLTINPNDSQFIETRKFEVADVARLFGIPPEMIGSESGNSQTYANVSERDLSLLKYSLAPWVVRIEQALTRLHLSEGADPDTFAKFNVSALLRADIKTRYEAYEIALASNWLTVDEVRALEDLPPLGQG